jgi:predicted metal-dependent hydrolase
MPFSLNPVDWISANTTKPKRPKLASKTTKEVKQLGSITYTHQISNRVRSYKLKIDPGAGLVAVTPRRFSQTTLNSFIEKNTEWIEKNLSKLTQKKAFFETESTVRVFDVLYQKEVQIDPNSASRIVINSDVQPNQPPSLIVSLQSPDQAKTKKLLTRFLKQTAEQYVTPRTKQLAEKMNVQYTKISYGEHKSQWGSCHISGALTFNWRLVHAPVAVIDYVIIHELAHRTHHNHSAAFWALVAKYDPNYSIHRNWLKKYGVSVG